MEPAIRKVFYVNAWDRFRWPPKHQANVLPSIRVLTGAPEGQQPNTARDSLSRTAWLLTSYPPDGHSIAAPVGRGGGNTPAPDTQPCGYNASVPKVFGFPHNIK